LRCLSRWLKNLANPPALGSEVKTGWMKNSFFWIAVTEDPEIGKDQSRDACWDQVATHCRNEYFIREGNRFESGAVDRIF
jgi:hypothetical protein